MESGSPTQEREKTLSAESSLFLNSINHKHIAKLVFPPTFEFSEKMSWPNNYYRSYVDFLE